MTETTLDPASSNPTRPQDVLDRTIDLTMVDRLSVAAFVVGVISFALRLVQLDHFALSPAEGRRAFQAFSFVRGSTSGPGYELPDTSPTLLLFQSLSIFLFGATDMAARLLPALFGAGIVVLAWLFWPFVGRARALGMMALAAISPTLLYSSRTADGDIAVAFFMMLFVVAVLRVGLVDSGLDMRRGWAITAGFALAAAFGSSPTSVSVIIAVLVGGGVTFAFDPKRVGAVRQAALGFRSTPMAAPLAYLSFIITLIVLYTRFFSDITALAGVGGTFADWGRLIAEATSTTPTQYFLLATLLYEILAIVFAIFAANRVWAIAPGYLPWSFFIGWFTAALLLFSFSSGRAPEQAIHTALPLVLLGGAGLGDLVVSLTSSAMARTRLAALFAAILGLAISVIAFVVLLDRTSDAFDRNRAIFQAIAVAILAVAPLAFAVYMLATAPNSAATPRRVGVVALAVLALFLGGYTIRSAVLLSYFNADDGIELLAQRTSTGSVEALVTRLRKLSRDVTVLDGSPRDPTGGHGLTIAIDRQVQWPLRWYFRDFPDARVVANGAAPASGSQVVIAPDDAGMAEAGYTPRTYPTLNRVPPVYTAPQIGSILRNIFLPSEWADGINYLLLRNLDVTAPPETLAVGLNGELANRVFPNTGPYGLTDRAGAGNGRGQFNNPRGITVSPDTGTTYVVDMSNGRVQRFDELGAFVGIWSGEDGGVSFKVEGDNLLGPTGITTSPDGQLIYVADTWNHRIVILDQSGRLVREIGTFGDTGDSPDASIEPGLFFGPRDVEVTDEEIYVSDTGNERVQVFSLDGTFRRAIGGYGSDPGKLIEPVGIEIGPDGRLYVADSTNARISIFSTDGTPQAQWPVDAWAGELYFEPYLAFDQDGNLYATSSGTSSVEIFDLNGLLIDTLTQVGSEQLQEPIGITTAPDGSILITDSRISAVLRHAPLGPPLIPDDDEIVDESPEEPTVEATPEASPEPLIELHAASPAASPMASPVASPAVSPVAG